MKSADGVGDVATFERLESNVRSYCRAFPTVFTRAKDAIQFDEQGREYVDFFAGAGALNYGHNPDFIKKALVRYLEDDGVMHSLDMFTTAKRAFLDVLDEVVLKPRKLDYKVQFCGPTGANAVEAALKLARLKTGRVPVCAFTGGYHGLSLGALALTSNSHHREAAGVPLTYGSFLPYPAGPRPVADALERIEEALTDPCSGQEKPAAIILETVQAEGGIYEAPTAWLKGLRAICDRHGIIMIVDDIQAGCGRTGTFFSFERAGIVPDVVTLSKSISGYGLPAAIVLMKRELDVWKPAQHTGTFRGHQLAFVAGAAALELWRTPAFERTIAEREAELRATLERELPKVAPGASLRGRGLLFGIDFTNGGGPDVAGAVSRRCFERGLIIERCGRDDVVLKVMPPLTISAAHLARGLAILVGAMPGAPQP